MRHTDHGLKQCVSNVGAPISLPLGEPEGFTLIELLVVITIIVVLLALLTPAMDKALYEADMAVCAAQLRGIAGAAQVYAAANNRMYPYRDGVFSESAFSPDTLARDTQDDRPKLMEYLSLDIFIDPFTDRVDLDVAPPGSHAASEGGAIYATYHLFFGWQWRVAGGGRGMRKVGDRFTWTDANDRTYQLDLLAGDHDYIDQAGGSAHASHPDDAGVLFNLVLNNEDFSGTSEVAYAVTAGQKQTLSRWQSILTNQRGTFDSNFVRADGSSARYDDVTFDEGADPSRQRFFIAPEFSDGQMAAQNTIQLPAR